MSNRLSRAAKTEIVFLLHTFEIHRVSREFHYLARLLDEGIDVYSISDEAYETCTTSPTMDAFMERLFADGQPLELCIVRRRTGVLPSIVEEFLRQMKPCKFRGLTLTQGECSRGDLLRWIAVAEAAQRPCATCTSRGGHKAHEIHHIQNDATGQTMIFNIELGVVDVSQAGWRSFRCKGLMRRVTVHLGDRLPCPQMAVFSKGYTLGRTIPLVFDNVFTFLDRAEIDKCLLVCRQWNDLIRRFNGTLALHNLLAIRFEVLTLAKEATDGISDVGRFAIDYEYTREQLSDMLTWTFNVMRIRTFEISMRMSMLMENIAFLFENEVLRSSETVHLRLENDLDGWERVPVERFTQMLVAFALESKCKRLTITYYFGVPPFDVNVIVEAFLSAKPSTNSISTVEIISQDASISLPSACDNAAFTGRLDQLRIALPVSPLSAVSGEVAVYHVDGESKKTLTLLAAGSGTDGFVGLRIVPGKLGKEDVFV
ncbi:hypothetical protein AAVH_14701 [Aphelenchoides avenae]|nr:hypothetical protein AAVH_14701 [Aphelenchus avenae]